MLKNKVSVNSPHTVEELTEYATGYFEDTL